MTTVFIVETELQYKAAIEHAKHCENVLFFSADPAIRQHFNGRCLPLDKKHAAGFIGKIRNIIRYTQSVCSFLTDSETVELFFPHLNDTYNNALYTHLKRVYRERFSATLLPDGILSYSGGDVSTKEHQRQFRYNKFLRWFSLGRIGVTTFTGDKFGRHIVGQQLIFGDIKPNIPNCHYKNVDYPTHFQSAWHTTKTLVVGQCLESLTLESDNTIRTISSAISKVVQQAPAAQTLYARHPRSLNNEFQVPGSNELQEDYVFLEDIIARHGISRVISCSSSVLFNVKLFFGDNVEAISIGLDALTHIDQTQKNNIKSAFQKAGVIVL